MLDSCFSVLGLARGERPVGCAFSSRMRGGHDAEKESGAAEHDELSPLVMVLGPGGSCHGTPDIGSVSNHGMLCYTLWLLSAVVLALLLRLHGSSSHAHVDAACSRAG